MAAGGESVSLPTPTQHFSFGRSGLLLLQPVAARTKRVDVIQHPIQQRFRRRRGDAGSLQWPGPVWAYVRSQSECIRYPAWCALGGKEISPIEQIMNKIATR